MQVADPGGGHWQPSFGRATIAGMPEPSIADLEAEREWRLARTTFTSRAERDANEDRIRRLDQLIAEARAPKPPPPPEPGMPGELIAVALILTAFALFLAF